jgi:hypothetical protein
MFHSNMTIPESTVSITTLWGLARPPCEGCAVLLLELRLCILRDVVMFFPPLFPLADAH